jgi:hypothetical protein
MRVSGFISESESVWPAETVKMKINDQKKKSVRAHTQHPIFARLAFQSPGKNRDKRLTFIVRVMLRRVLCVTQGYREFKVL